MALIWILRRLRCLCCGHSDLSALASYGAFLPDGRSHELHFCHACDSVVWIYRPKDAAKQMHRWDNLGT